MSRDLPDAPIRAQDFYEVMPLYRAYRLTLDTGRLQREPDPPETVGARRGSPQPQRQPREAWTCAAIDEFSGAIDLYCAACGKDSVFKPAGDDSTRPSATDLMRALQPTLFAPPNVRTVHRSFVCSRSSEHDRADFFFRVSGDTVMKIGQAPSVYDLEDQSLRRFRARFPIDERELRRAIGLHSHGVGVGAFVYLRRIFERLMTSLASGLASSGRLEIDHWNGLPVADKLKALQKEEPGFLSSLGADVYGVLSKGIHELDEEYCLDWFAPLRLAIEQILHEKLERLATEERRTELQRSLREAKKHATKKR